MSDIEEIIRHTPAAKNWSKIGVKPHHGIALPLFSLHTSRSCGIGEYLDLIALLHFCKEVGLSVIQLLPLNDTGLDTSPYNALSGIALNPLHISLRALDSIEELHIDWSPLHRLNETPRVDYRQVREAKEKILNDYFKLTFGSVSQSDSYKSFLHEHSDWLENYALFKALKERHGYLSWEDWPENLKNPSTVGYQKLSNENKERIDYHSYTQYLCFSQMKQVKEEADRLQVLLKGDISILLNRDSADVWGERHFFILDKAAGAPPDAYSETGQYWGFPLYNWEAIEHSQYTWWKKRLRMASHLFHLYRLDHVVGFFRIWGIPLGGKPMEGTFIPEDKSMWIEHGKKIMEMMLESSEMLPIAEDLGTVPPEVRVCLTQMGICGTKVMRWERRWNEDGGFIPIDHYNPLSMTTVSTHDSGTLQLWWEHNPREAKLFAATHLWDYEPTLSLEKHGEILRMSHHSSSLFHINLLQEYLALFSDLAWPNKYDELINIPSKVLDTNWTYRTRVPLEMLLEHKGLKALFKNIID